MMMIDPFKSMRGKRGFSIVEVVFVSFLGSLVLGLIIVALIWSQKIYQETLVIAEMTTASRMVREKTLYHLVGDGGLASLDLKTCQIGPRWQDISFSIGKGMPVYQLAYSPNEAEAGFDLQKITASGTNGIIAPWIPIHNVSIDPSTSMFHLKMMTDDIHSPDPDVYKKRQGNNLKIRYYLSSDFFLSMPVGQKNYSRKCHVFSPVVNDFSE